MPRLNTYTIIDFPSKIISAPQRERERESNTEQRVTESERSLVITTTVVIAIHTHSCRFTEPITYYAANTAVQISLAQ